MNKLVILCTCISLTACFISENTIKQISEHQQDLHVNQMDHIDQNINQLDQKVISLDKNINDLDQKISPMDDPNIQLCPTENCNLKYFDKNVLQGSSISTSTNYELKSNISSSFGYSQSQSFQLQSTIGF